MKRYIVIWVVLALVLSEICLYFNKTAGFTLYCLLVALCLLSLSRVKVFNNYSKLITVFMIVPMARIIGMFISLEFFWKTALFYAILLFLSFFYSVRFRLDHGNRREKLGLFPFAIVIGVILGFIGNAYFSGDKYLWLVYFIPLIAYSEEILFRGMIQNLLERNYWAPFSILISALVYGVFSLGYGFMFAVFIFLCSIIIGLIYSDSKNIFLAVTINMIIHYFIFIL